MSILYSKIRLCFHKLRIPECSFQAHRRHRFSYSPNNFGLQSNNVMWHKTGCPRRVGEQISCPLLIELLVKHSRLKNSLNDVTLDLWDK